MALPVVIPNTFANANASIPLSQLDNNFTTLSAAINGIANGTESLANVSITGGAIANVVISSGNATFTTANASTLDAANVEVTTIKARDGSNSASIANSSGAMTIGTASQTGTISFGISTLSQTINIGSGATALGETKAINIGTGGLSASSTDIYIGSSSSITTVDVTGTCVFNNLVNLLANPVLSAGTANGIVYLNASKIATTGTAINFDGNNLRLGGTTSPASATASLVLFNGTAPTGSVVNGVVVFAQDVAASSELRVRDEAGNVTTLSPHNFSLIPEGPSEDMAWSYYSERGDRKVNIDMMKLARAVERLTGEKLVYEE